MNNINQDWTRRKFIGTAASAGAALMSTHLPHGLFTNQTQMSKG